MRVHKRRRATGQAAHLRATKSFNDRLRVELLNIEEFARLTEARVITEDWRIKYNTYRPHSALGGFTPAEYAAKENQHQPDHA